MVHKLNGGRNAPTTKENEMEQKIEKIKQRYITEHKRYIKLTSSQGYETTYEKRLSTKLDTYELILGMLDVDSDEVLREEELIS